MAEKKSILEEALLDINKIQEALNANTKEILRSVAKEEIDSVVKESLMDNKEEEYEEEDLDGGEETGFGAETGAGDELGLDGGEETGLGDTAGLDGIEGSEEVAPEMGPELGMDAGALGGDEMDMTASTDDEVIAIYKRLSGEDEIEIVGDEIHLNISEPGEYVVKMNDNAGAGAGEDLGLDDTEELGLDGADEFGSEEVAGDEDGVDYEIEMGDEESEEGESEAPDFGGEESTDEPEEGGEEEEEELDENIGNVNGHAGHQGQRRHGSSHLGYGKSSVDGEKFVKEAQAAKKVLTETRQKYNSLLTEARKIKVENEEFRLALKEFRGKLLETVVTNANLAYVVRLVSEHSTTKAEKENIIKRFDEVSSLTESKKLYKSIINELETRKPIREAIENKVTKDVTTSSSKQLNESTAYVDPSTKRIIDLMKRVG